MNGDLISRSGLLKKIRAYADSKVANEGVETANNILKTVQVIEKMPAVDAAPVVHGRWIERPFLLGTTHVCSRCNDYYGMPHGIFNYCPNCGAKMDEEER